ncbi:MAG TPA: hypothetical protein VEC16_06270 [Alphaproteobacteria bacterium]|nr:hypothetical protein [Alphaproteobacteria bacterium]
MSDIEKILNEENSKDPGKNKKRFAVVMTHDFDTMMAHHAILKLIASRHYGGLIVVRNDEEKRMVENSKEYAEINVENLRNLERERIIIKPIEIKDIYIEKKKKKNYFVNRKISYSPSMINYGSVPRRAYKIIKQP